jgi:hypothetical protein
MMGKVILVLAALTVLVLPGFGQPDAWANKLFEGKVEHDFGVVQRGAMLKHSFKITNIYKMPLEITDVRVTAGALKAKPSAKILQPGESATVDIEFDAARFIGMKTVKVFVSFGPTYVSTATLTVSANAK